MNIRKFMKALKELIFEPINRAKRGREPKHDLREYLRLIVAKEARKASLREAEVEYSKLICKERVDHSVIHYWEKKFSDRLKSSLIPTTITRIG